MSNKLRDVVERAVDWPEEDQELYAQLGLEIEEQRMRAKPVNSRERQVLRKRAGQRLAEMRSRLRRLQPEGGDPNIEEEIDAAVREARGHNSHHG